MDVSEVRFGQLDFYDSYGYLHAQNSLWGIVEWTYVPPASGVRYLHVAAGSPNLPEGDVEEWIVRGIPLHASELGIASTREAAYFDWSTLGLEEGDDVSTVMYSVLVSDAASPPPEPAADGRRAEVETDEVTECRIEIPPASEFMAPVGAPEPAVEADPGPRVAAEREIKPVQEGVNQCMPGSFARSLDWLSRAHDLGIGRTPQQIFEDLVGRGVGVVPPGGGTHGSIVADWIKKKDEYAKEKTGNKVVTKVWDGGNYIDPIPGVNETKPPETTFGAWIKREIATEDVEVAFTRVDGSSHIVTVVDVTTDAAGNVTGIKYRDDEAQGNATRGDTAVKNAPITKAADGTYKFGDASKTIYFAVSESKV